MPESPETEDLLIDVASFMFLAFSYITILYAKIVTETMSMKGMSVKSQIIFFLAYTSMAVNAIYYNLDKWEIIKPSSISVLILITIIVIYYQKPSDLEHDRFSYEEFLAILLAVITVVIMNTRTHDLVYLWIHYTEAVALLPQIRYNRSAGRVANPITALCAFQVCHKMIEYIRYEDNLKSYFHPTAGWIHIGFCAYVILMKGFELLDRDENNGGGIKNRSPKPVVSEASGEPRIFTRRQSERISRRRNSLRLN